MAVSVAQFLAAHPEFSDDRAGAAPIAQNLADAEARVWTGLGSEVRDLAVRLLAAHLLAISPWGQQARLAPADGVTTTYGEEYQRLVRRWVVGRGKVASCRVLGSA